MSEPATERYSSVSIEIPQAIKADVLSAAAVHRSRLAYERRGRWLLVKAWRWASTFFLRRRIAKINKQIARTKEAEHA